MSAPGRWLETALLHLAHAYAGQVAPKPVDADELIDAEPRVLIELKQAEINEAVETARSVSQQIGNNLLA